MGQQQLLLIVTGVIIVGLAITLVINLFEVNALEANRDAVYGDAMNLAGFAQRYYQLPRMLSGGGGAFTGFTLPTEMLQNGNGNYSLTSVTADRVTIQGDGNEHDRDGKSYHVTIVVTPTKIESASSVLR